MIRASYGPTALVTGASNGTGEAVAYELAAKGLNLIVVARNQERLEVLAANLRDQHDVEVHVVVADLGKPGAVQRVLDATQSSDIGLFVAAAGFGSVGAFLDQDIAIELDMIDVNCRSVVDLTYGINRRMVRRGSGGVVLFGSIVGFQGVGYSANYAATKAFALWKAKRRRMTTSTA